MVKKKNYEKSAHVQDYFLCKSVVNVDDDGTADVLRFRMIDFSGYRYNSSRQFSART